MDLDTFIIAVFCWIDDALHPLLSTRRWRQRGPAPVLADSEVLAIEVVGEYLGRTQDQALYGYFRRHYGHCFLALRRVHRTTFARQAANLWQVKERLWQALPATVAHDPEVALVDRFALPVGQFARAYRCPRFAGAAAFGKDHLLCQTCYGFRVHVRLCWPGVSTHFTVAPANVAEVAVVPQLAADTQGGLIGDRNYWSASLANALRHRSVRLRAPLRSANHDPWPHWTARLSRLRDRIDTVFGQLAERCAVKRLWARDPWHLASRLLRKVLMHTVAVCFNTRLGRPPPHLDGLVA